MIPLTPLSSDLGKGLENVFAAGDFNHGWTRITQDQPDE
jgi:hypothetical protein